MEQSSSSHTVTQVNQSGQEIPKNQEIQAMKPILF